MKTYAKCSPGKILVWLRDQPEPVRSHEVAAGVGVTQRQAIDALTALHQRGAVQRHGRRNKFRYSLPKREDE